MDEKEQKFIRIAEKRVNDLLQKFRLVGNLADKRNYRYSDEQARLIIKVVEDEVRALKAKFQTTSDQNKPFTLS